MKAKNKIVNKTEAGKMAVITTIKKQVNSRFLICPICNEKCDTLCGKSCKHLQKIIIRKNYDHIAIFKSL